MLGTRHTWSSKVWVVVALDPVPISRTLMSRGCEIVSASCVLTLSFPSPNVADSNVAESSTREA
jgi:hypothetical protein